MDNYKYPNCNGTKKEISYCLDLLGRIEDNNSYTLCGMCCGTGLVDRHTAEFFKKSK